MTANLDALRALIAGLVQQLHGAAQPTDDDLVALAERCSHAHIAELGQILFDAKSVESQKVVAAEIQRRLSQ